MQQQRLRTAGREFAPAHGLFRGVDYRRVRRQQLDLRIGLLILLICLVDGKNDQHFSLE